MWEIRSAEGSDSARASPPDWDRKIGVRASALQPVPRRRRSSAIPFLHTPQSVLEKHGERERQSEARKRWKDFMPPPRLRSSAVCSVWLGGKVVRRANELPTHKYTAAGDAGAIYHDWKPQLCPPLLARHLWHPQSRASSPSSNNIRSGCSKWDASVEGVSIWTVAAPVFASCW